MIENTIITGVKIWLIDSSLISSFLNKIATTHDNSAGSKSSITGERSIEFFRMNSELRERMMVVLNCCNGSIMKDLVTACGMVFSE